MEPSKFGDSYDMAKLRVMQWLVPGKWTAHPMWYNEKPAPVWARPFLVRYAQALNVRIVSGGASQYRDAFLPAARRCTEHLLLDPDKGLERPRNHRVLPKTHVTFDEFIRIVNSSKRQDKITLIYDQAYQTGPDLVARIGNKIQDMRNADANIHAVAYIAHRPNVTFMWAVKDCKVITEATQRMQMDSQFPVCRFVDDGCGHVG